MANENALRDGNGTASLLYENNGETKRVSIAQPLPIEQPIKTANMEVTNSVNVIFIQPAAGKRVVVKGAAVLNEPTLTGESRIFFANGQIVHRVYGSDQSGYIPMNIRGQVDEALRIETTGIAGGSRVFFVVNYIEE